MGLLHFIQYCFKAHATSGAAARPAQADHDHGLKMGGHVVDAAPAYNYPITSSESSTRKKASLRRRRRHAADGRPADHDGKLNSIQPAAAAVVQQFNSIRVRSSSCNSLINLPNFRIAWRYHEEYHDDDDHAPRPCLSHASQRTLFDFVVESMVHGKLASSAKVQKLIDICIGAPTWPGDQSSCVSANTISSVPYSSSSSRSDFSHGSETSSPSSSCTCDSSSCGEEEGEDRPTCQTDDQCLYDKDIATATSLLAREIMRQVQHQLDAGHYGVSIHSVSFDQPSLVDEFSKSTAGPKRPRHSFGRPLSVLY